MLKKFFVPSYVYEAKRIQEEIYKLAVAPEDVSFLEKMCYERPRFYPDEVKASIPRFEYVKRASYVYMHSLAAQVSHQWKDQLVSIGDKYYDWKYYPSLLDKRLEQVFVCAGAGINISFEIALAEQFPDAQAVILDPSPQSVNTFENFHLPPNLEFIPVGLAGRDETLRFYKPNLPGVGSLSTCQLNPGDDYFELPVKCVKTILDDMGAIPEQLSFLKFDVEGAEHEVIDYLIQTNILPNQITFEFDQPVPPWTVADTLRKLLTRGYEVADISELNILLVKLPSS